MTKNISTFWVKVVDNSTKWVYYIFCKQEITKKTTKQTTKKQFWRTGLS